MTLTRGARKTAVCGLLSCGSAAVRLLCGCCWLDAALLLCCAGSSLHVNQVLSDVMVPASIVLLKNETVCAELSFRAAYDPSMELPSNPFQAPPVNVGPQPNSGSSSLPSAKKERLVDFDDGDRSEIEKLKADRCAWSRLGVHRVWGRWGGADYPSPAQSSRSHGNPYHPT